MTRTLTVKEYLLKGLNRRARERGDDVELVFEWPKQPVPLLNGPAPPELPAEELKKPFSNYRNAYRRY
jgi:hypothetical protein